MENKISKSSCLNLYDLLWRNGYEEKARDLEEGFIQSQEYRQALGNWMTSYFMNNPNEYEQLEKGVI